LARERIRIFKGYFYFLKASFSLPLSLLPLPKGRGEIDRGSPQESERKDLEGISPPMEGEIKIRNISPSDKSRRERLRGGMARCLAISN